MRSVTFLRLDMILLGFQEVENHYVSINNTEGINILGNIIEASAASLNPEYYGSLHNYGHIMLGRVVDPVHKFGMPPGVSSSQKASF
jgi:hypothetical protein